jgi:heat-inducible transcriptional repressor
MEETLSLRNKKVLEAVIREYIESAQPIGSRTISKLYLKDLSPATIRNIMADLEDMGCLIQTHTSSGRIPTDKGFRLYVDSILRIKGLAKSDKERINRNYQRLTPEINSILKETSKVLSLFSKNIGIVTTPKFSNIVLTHIEFVKLSSERVLAIFISESGNVYSRIIEVRKNLNDVDFNKINEYLNRIMSGLTLAKIRRKVAKEMKRVKNSYNKLYIEALNLSEEVLWEERDEEIYIEGQANIVDQPEFSNTAAMKSFLKALEEKKVLLKLLDKSMTSRGVQIFIGSENEFKEIKGCSIITSTYSKGNNILGALGVVGPIRMNYSKVIPLVEYTSKVLSSLLEH